jgi:hypothetical protein
MPKSTMNCDVSPFFDAEVSDDWHLVVETLCAWWTFHSDDSSRKGGQKQPKRLPCVGDVKTLGLSLTYLRHRECR